MEQDLTCSIYDILNQFDYTALVEEADQASDIHTALIKKIIETPALTIEGLCVKTRLMEHEMMIDEGELSLIFCIDSDLARL